MTLFRDLSKNFSYNNLTRTVKHYGLDFFLHLWYNKIL